MSRFGDRRCRIGGASSQSIAGSLQTTFTNCRGSGLETLDSAQLTLNK